VGYIFNNDLELPDNLPPISMSIYAFFIKDTLLDSVNENRRRIRISF